MWRIKVLIRAVFGFSRTETNGFVVLLPLSLAILFSEPVFRVVLGPGDDPLDTRFQDSVTVYIHSRLITADSQQTSERVPIDPHTAAESQLIRSGLKPSLAKRLVNYRQKGGALRNKEDLRKIYGIDTTWIKETTFLFNTIPSRKEQKPFQKKGSRHLELIDINQVDSLSLLELRGIGPARARRIVLFREKLGGFVQIEQLREIYGLDSPTYRELKKNCAINENFRPRQINLNTTNWDELTKHPYVDYREAKAILSYRAQHGHFDSVGQIRHIRLLSEQKVSRLIPYLTVD